jgi:hypothetical protein
MERAPEFFLDKHEPYGPCTYGDYIRNSTLRKSSGEPVLDTIVDPNDITKYGGDHMLEIKKNAKGGILDPAKYPTKLEVYVIQNTMKYNEDTFYDTYYIMLFAYNGTIEPHLGDEEYVMIRTDGNNNPMGMYYSNHSGGLWVPWWEVPKNKDGHPIVYIARESHAMFPSTGVFPRALGFGNDNVDPADKPLPYNLVVIKDAVKTQKYLGAKVARSPDETRPIFDNGYFSACKRQMPSDFPSLIRSRIGKYFNGLCLLVFGLLVMSLGLTIKGYSVAAIFTAILGAIAGILYTSATTPWQYANTVKNTLF